MWIIKEHKMTLVADEKKSFRTTQFVKEIKSLDIILKM